MDKLSMGITKYLDNFLLSISFKNSVRERIYDDVNEFLQKNSGFRSFTIGFFQSTFSGLAIQHCSIFGLFLANRAFQWLRRRYRLGFVRLNFDLRFLSFSTR